MESEKAQKYRFSFEEWDQEYQVEEENGYKNFFYRLSQFFRIPDNFPFDKKVLFCPGTAPCVKSEIPRIFYATGFDEATLVDPRYQDRSPLEIDLRAIASIADQGAVRIDWQDKNEMGIKHRILFKVRGKDRVVTLIACDATMYHNIPRHNVFFSGGRVCGDEAGEQYANLKDDNFSIMLGRLDRGGFFVPDHDFAMSDDHLYFPDEVKGFGLREVTGTRTGATVVVPDPDFQYLLMNVMQLVFEEVGFLRTAEEVGMLKYYVHNNVDTGEYEEFDSLEDFWSDHPEIKKDICEINDDGVFFESFNICVPVERLAYSDEEEAVLREIRERSLRRAMSFVPQRGVAMYRKVKRGLWG